MSSASYMLLATSSRPQSPTTPTQASAAMSDEQMDLVDILRSGEDSRIRRFRPPEALPSSPAVVLFCGADQDTETDWDEHRPCIVEMLPQTSPPPSRKRQRRSNGCGARIHARAVPDRRWRGLLEGASAAVVGLADEYFTGDMKHELSLGKERCGCNRTGVGCAICGNPLGTLFTPCARHSPSSNSNFSSSHYTFLRTTVSPPLPPLPTRRVSIFGDEPPTGRVEREALSRRLREREELRARIRVSQQQQLQSMRIPPRGDASRENEMQQRELDLLFIPSRGDASRENSRAEWERRIEEVRLQESAGRTAADGRLAFEAWADATLQRATATAASDVPVVDLSPLMDLRRSASPPEPAPASPAVREVSEEERRRDWQRGVLPGTSWSYREWPTITRTIERTTAPPEQVLDDFGRPDRTNEGMTENIPPGYIYRSHRSTVVEPLPEPVVTVEELRRDVLARRAERAQWAPGLSRRGSRMRPYAEEQEEPTTRRRTRTFFER